MEDSKQKTIEAEAFAFRRMVEHFANYSDEVLYYTEASNVTSE